MRARRRTYEIVAKYTAEMEELKRQLREERQQRAQLQVLGEWSNDRASVQ